MNWRKSTYSQYNGNCAEAASGEGAVLVRDTADRGGPVLAVTLAAWRDFLSAVKR